MKGKDQKEWVWVMGGDKEEKKEKRKRSKEEKEKHRERKIEREREKELKREKRRESETRKEKKEESLENNTDITNDKIANNKDTVTVIKNEEDNSSGRYEIELIIACIIHPPT